MKIVGILSVTTLRHADLLKTTMLKLQSRKQKQVDSSSHALSFLDSLNASRNESNAETKVAASTDDAVDRGVFFDRFHSETKGLMSLLTVRIEMCNLGNASAYSGCRS